MKRNSRGFTIFFATLVASLALAIGLAIYDITVRQLNLSTTTVQSQYAIFAADSGAECALYWDSKYNSSGSAFATSSTSVVPSSGITCGSYDIAAVGTPPVPFVPAPTNWGPWSTQTSSNTATTTFTLSFPPYSYCAIVQVAKVTNQSSGIINTTIYSHGYNTCATNAQNQLERELKVSY
jgi:hypothetical protein